MVVTFGRQDYPDDGTDDATMVGVVAGVVDIVPDVDDFPYNQAEQIKSRPVQVSLQSFTIHPKKLIFRPRVSVFQEKYAPSGW